MTAYLQRRSGTSWLNVAKGKLSTNGRYAFGIKPTTRATHTYRVVWYADADHQGAQTVSKVLAVSSHSAKTVLWPRSVDDRVLVALRRPGRVSTRTDEAAVG